MLLEIISEENDKPKKGVAELDPEVRKAAENARYFESEDYEMFLEFGQGVALPKEGHKYQVRLSVQDFTLQTKEGKEKRANYTRWSERFEAQSFKLLYNGLGPAGKPGAISPNERVSVYLVDEDKKPVSWWKGKLSDFDSVDSKFKWLQLKADRAVDEVENDYQAGMVAMKLGVKKKGGDVYNFKQAEPWKKAAPRRMGAWKVRCYLFQCKDIPAADEDGTSDPYVQVWSTEKEKLRTKVVEDNLNPIFMTTKDLLYDFDAGQHCQDDTYFGTKTWGELKQAAVSDAKFSEAEWFVSFRNYNSKFLTL